MKNARSLHTSTGARAKKVPATDHGTPRSKTTLSLSDPKRKASSGANSIDESQKNNAIGPRPSLVGMLAAGRLSMGLIKRFRNNQAASKVGSTISGERHEAPVQNFEPTYRMEPTNPFRSSRVQEVIKSTLEEHLKGRTYRHTQATDWCQGLTEVIKERVKGLGYDRHRYVVTVLMGQKKDQGMVVSSRCSWDDKRDNFATFTYETSEMFCTGTVYGVYKE